jgi:fatty acid desaturase
MYLDWDFAYSMLPLAIAAMGCLGAGRLVRDKFAPSKTASVARIIFLFVAIALSAIIALAVMWNFLGEVVLVALCVFTACG